MSSKADKLVKKYHEAKEKAFNNKHVREENQKQINFIAGSRMMDYLLTRVYVKQMRSSVRCIGGFARFDKEFFEATERMICIFQKKNVEKVRSYFQIWTKKALKPIQTKNLLLPLSSSISTSKQIVTQTLLQVTTNVSKSHLNHLQTISCLKLFQILSKSRKINLKTSLSYWKSLSTTVTTQRSHLKTLVSRKYLLTLKSSFKILKRITNLPRPHTQFLTVTSEQLFLQSLFSNFHWSTRLEKYQREILQNRATFSLIIHCKIQKSLTKVTIFTDSQRKQQQLVQLQLIMSELKRGIVVRKLGAVRADEGGQRDQRELGMGIKRVDKDRVKRV